MFPVNAGLLIKNDSQDAGKIMNAAAISMPNHRSFASQEGDDPTKGNVSVPESQSSAPLSEEQSPKRTDRDMEFGIAPLVDFQDPEFRHDECPPHPAYCRNKQASLLDSRSNGAVIKGRVSRGHKFSTGQATRKNVRWLLRHSSCSNSETLHRAWQHRLASTSSVPLRQNETKDSFLSRWYPQWLTKIAAEVKDIRPPTKSQIKANRKQRRSRAQQRRNESRGE